MGRECLQQACTLFKMLQVQHANLKGWGTSQYIWVWSPSDSVGLLSLHSALLFQSFFSTEILGGPLGPGFVDCFGTTTMPGGAMTDFFSAVSSILAHLDVAALKAAARSAQRLLWMIRTYSAMK
jgi:hypothetical protein